MPPLHPRVSRSFDMPFLLFLGSDCHPASLLCTPLHVLRVHPPSLFSSLRSRRLVVYIPPFLDSYTVAVLSSTIIVLVRVCRVTDVATRFPNFLLYYLLDYDILNICLIDTPLAQQDTLLVSSWRAGTCGTDLYIRTIRAIHTIRYLRSFLGECMRTVERSNACPIGAIH